MAYFYFAVGAAQIFWVMAGVLGRKADEIAGLSRDDVGTAFRWRTAGLLVAAFGLVGALPWIVQGIAAPRYADQTLSALMEKLDGSRAVQALGLKPADIQTFTAEPQATLQIGRLLYPRFFTRGDGLASAHPWPAYAPREFPRLGFVLLNQSRHDAVMPLRQVGHGFTQGADAIILGCQRQDYIEVRLILFPDSDSAYLSTPFAKTCN